MALETPIDLSGQPVRPTVETVYLRLATIPSGKSDRGDVGEIRGIWQARGVCPWPGIWRGMAQPTINRLITRGLRPAFTAMGVNGREVKAARSGNGGGARAQSTFFGSLRRICGHISARNIGPQNSVSNCLATGSSPNPPRAISN